MLVAECFEVQSWKGNIAFGGGLTVLDCTLEIINANLVNLAAAERNYYFYFVQTTSALTKSILVFAIVLILSPLQLLAMTLIPADSSSSAMTPKFSGLDGTIIIGYVDQGGFLNFTGPNVSMSFRHQKLTLGMLPSLRFKEDKSLVKNSFVMPTLGVGLTYCYRKFAVQVPLYYNTKTATSDGRWTLGIGIGLRLK